MSKVHSPSTLHPSHPTAFKSTFSIEDTDWNADLKVDYDSGVNPINVKTIVKFLKNLYKPQRRHFYRIQGYTFKIYTTGKGHHLRIWLHRYSTEPLPATTILRFQRDLDDDPMRQKFNASRVRKGEPYWNVLWNLKIRNGKTISKEEQDKNLEDQVVKLSIK